MRDSNAQSVASGSFELTLLVQTPGSLDQEVFVQHGLTIGRGHSNTICIDDETVERLHARVVRKPDGATVAECESEDAKIVTESGDPISRIVLAPGLSFSIGPARITCRKRETRATVVVADSRWTALCPRCGSSMVDLPPDTTKCPSCGLGVCFFRAAGAESGAPGFAGWLPLEVGPYRIRAFAAEGGMGIVLRGLHAKAEMPAAVKLLKESAANASWLARFEREAETLKKLVHPNIVRLQGSGRDGNMHWLATDWVDGLSLSRLMRLAKTEKKAFPISRMAGILRQVVDGLKYLHGQGVVHRDLKPSNILVGRDSSVKLVDLGIARRAEGWLAATALTITGTAMGTEGYMAPEQIDGQDVSAATDVFALGVLWYELVTGRRPVGTYLSMRGFRPDIPEASEAWDTLVARCLSYDPSARPSLSEIAEGLSSPADTTTVASGSLIILPDETEAPASRGKRWLGITSLVLLGIGLCVGGYFGYHWWANTQASPSARNGVEKQANAEMDAIEARGKAEDARALAQQASAERYSRTLWEEADGLYQAGAVSFEKQGFSPAKQQWFACKDAFVRAQMAAQVGQKNEVEAIKARDGAENAQRQARDAGADRSAVTSWRQAVATYERGRSSFGQDHFSEARKCWEQAKAGFAQSLAYTHKVSVARSVYEQARSAYEQARSAYEREVDRHDRNLLAKHGGMAWRTATDMASSAASSGNREPDKAASLYEQAKGLIPKAAAEASRRSYEDAKRRGGKILQELGGAAWKAANDASAEAQSAEDTGAFTSAIPLYRKAEDFLSQAAKIASDVQTLQGFRQSGKITEQQFVEGKRLLIETNTDSKTELSRVAYRSLIRGDVSPERLGDALNDVGSKQSSDDLSGRTQRMKKNLDEYAVTLKKVTSEHPDAVSMRQQISVSREKLLAEIQAKLKDCQAADADMATRHYAAGDPYRQKISGRISELRGLLFDLRAPEIVLDFGGVTMKIVPIPTGKFLMGSPDAKGDRHKNETPQREVELTKPLYIGAYEVTQEQYQSLMNANPSKFKGPQNPVVSVTWKEAVEFCKKLSKVLGRTVRLPTEAEWEYACRAGNTGSFCYGNPYGKLHEYAWYSANSGKRPRPVGKKKPNAWGVYDMHGNVGEWCADWFDENYYHKKNDRDPRGSHWGSRRVVRGGTFGISPKWCRSAVRGSWEPDKANDNVGFRVVLELPGNVIDWPGAASSTVQPAGKQVMPRPHPAKPPTVRPRRQSGGSAERPR